MKKYCYTENGNVIGGPQDLPTSFANVSNFHVLDAESLKSYGWLPYERVSEDKPIFVGSNYEILEDRVVENYITRDPTEQEINIGLENEKQSKWNEVRIRRNELLAESDVYVVSDRWEEMDIQSKQSWSNYRKQLRDIPQIFIDPDLVEYPNKPL